MINRYLLITVVLLIVVFTRFYNLNWGAPFYFHPDERNIASSISQLNYPSQMNPHFFAYGSLPIYVIYFSGIVANFLTHHQPVQVVLFEQAILISRFYTAIFSVVLIPLLYVIGKKINIISTGIYASLFAAVSTGFIQFAHFGTFEMWTAFFSTILLFCCLILSKSLAWRHIVITSIVLGILFAIKISNLIFVCCPILACIIYITHTKKNSTLFIFSFIKIIYLYVITFSIAILTNPYILYDQKDFFASITYESQVGFGTLPVFYTQEFFNKIPIIFQFLHIYPFLLNPFLTVLFVICFFISIYLLLISKSYQIFLLLLFFCITFFSQAFLFTKWTRYMLPSLPFIYLLIALVFTKPTKHILFSKLSRPIIVCSLLVSTIFALAYMITAFVEPDTRIAAANWASKHAARNISTASEVYDIGITAFNPYFSNIQLYNPYDYDVNTEDLTHEFQAHDMIILPSQRIVKTRLSDIKQFPKSHMLYAELFSGKLGFTKVYQTPCDIFCNITYLGDPIMRYEETASVFERPVVFIFQKK